MSTVYLLDSDGNAVQVALVDGRYVLTTSDDRAVRMIESLVVTLEEQSVLLAAIADGLQTLIEQR